MKIIEAHLIPDLFKPDKGSSSWIVYITKTQEEADTILEVARSNLSILDYADNWHYSIYTEEVQRNCCVPEFFHNHGYFATIIEHNNGDYNKIPKYELYIVE